MMGPGRGGKGNDLNALASQPPIREILNQVRPLAAEYFSSQAARLD